MCKNKKTFISFLLLLISLFSFFISFNVNAATKEISYIKTAEEFKYAIVSRERVIYVDDITFEANETVILHDNVTIIGKNEKSVIKNLHFQVVGSLNYEDKIKIFLKNIIFDGCFDESSYDIYQEKSFFDVFGNDYSDGFLWVDDKYVGYYDIDIDCCEFTNYIAYWGAVIYLPANSADIGNKEVSLSNCKAYHNFGTERIISITDHHTILDIKNVEMYDNYCISKMMNLVNLHLAIDTLYIHDNNFLPLDSEDYYSERNDRNMVRGGGIYIGSSKGVIKNMTIENNKTLIGGGMFLVLNDEGTKNLTFVDCVFKNNKALVYGGAVAIESYVGYPVYFTNCIFANNEAPIGSSFCAKPFILDKADCNTSVIEISFCDFYNNISEDKDSFEYYYEGYTKTKRDGKINVYACRIQDDTFLTGNGTKEDNYNVISPNAINEETVFVPASDYISWANGYYASKTISRGAGYSVNNGNKINTLQPILYSICTIISLIIALVYFIKSTEKHIETILITCSVIVINAGYFLLSISWNITSALLFNNLIYLGNALLPLFFMMAVSIVCRVKIHKPFKIALVCITSINFLFTTTVWFSNLFYINPSYEIINGVVDIVKENGILHTLYKFYVFAYFIITFLIMIYALKKKKVAHILYAIIIFFAEAVCLLVWVIEMMVSLDYELLSFAYIMFSFLLLLLFRQMEMRGILSTDNTIFSSEISTLCEESKKDICLEEITTICDKLVEKKNLSRREAEILALILQGYTTLTISEILFLSKNTIKSHTANIYKKLGINSREELKSRVLEELDKE